MVDVVITYVDGRDSEWRESYSQATGKSIEAKRFRDWDTLKFLFRGIERFMPFVGKVHLVVSSASQVPSWIDPAKVHIVLHKDIIPERFLPTFNSTTIELFIHKIEGLSERFIYFNDDIFPLKPLSEEDFFPEGKIATGFSRMWLRGGLFRSQTRNSYLFAASAAQVSSGLSYMRPQHTCTPMLRNLSAELYAKAEDKLLGSITPLRTVRNCNQYVFTDYAYLTGRAVNRRISAKHISMALWTAEKIAAYIVNPDRSLVGINDVDMLDLQFENYHKAIQTAFLKVLPDISIFERV